MKEKVLRQALEAIAEYGCKKCRQRAKEGLEAALADCEPGHPVCSVHAWHPIKWEQAAKP